MPPTCAFPGSTAGWTGRIIVVPGPRPTLARRHVQSPQAVIHPSPTSKTP